MAVVNARAVYPPTISEPHGHENLIASPTFDTLQSPLAASTSHNSGTQAFAEPRNPVATDDTVTSATRFGAKAQGIIAKLELDQQQLNRGASVTTVAACEPCETRPNDIPGPLRDARVRVPSRELNSVAFSQEVRTHTGGSSSEFRVSSRELQATIGGPRAPSASSDRTPGRSRARFGSPPRQFIPMPFQGVRTRSLSPRRFVKCLPTTVREVSATALRERVIVHSPKTEVMSPRIMHHATTVLVPAASPDSRRLWDKIEHVSGSLGQKVQASAEHQSEVVESLRGKLKELHGTVHSNQTRLQEFGALREQVQTNDGALDIVVRKLSTLERSFSCFREEVTSRLEKEVRENSIERVAREKSREVLFGKVNEANANLDAQKREACAQDALFNERISVLENVLEPVSLIDRVNALSKSVAGILQDRNTDIKDLETVKEKIRLTALKDDCVTLGKGVEGLAKAVETLSRDRASDTRNLISLRDDLQTKLHVVASKEELRSLEKNVNAWRDELKSLSQNCAEESWEVASLKQAIASKSETIEQLVLERSNDEKVVEALHRKVDVEVVSINEDLQVVTGSLGESSKALTILQEKFMGHIRRSVVQEDLAVLDDRILGLQNSMNKVASMYQRELSDFSERFGLHAIRDDMLCHAKQHGMDLNATKSSVKALQAVIEEIRSEMDLRTVEQDRASKVLNERHQGDLQSILADIQSQSETLNSKLSCSLVELGNSMRAEMTSRLSSQSQSFTEFSDKFEERWSKDRDLLRDEMTDMRMSQERFCESQAVVTNHIREQDKCINEIRWVQDCCVQVGKDFSERDQKVERLERIVGGQIASKSAVAGDGVSCQRESSLGTVGEWTNKLLDAIGSPKAVADGHRSTFEVACTSLELECQMLHSSKGTRTADTRFASDVTSPTTLSSSCPSPQRKGSLVSGIPLGQFSLPVLDMSACGPENNASAARSNQPSPSLAAAHERSSPKLRPVNLDGAEADARRISASHDDLYGAMPSIPIRTPSVEIPRLDSPPHIR